MGEVIISVVGDGAVGKTSVIKRLVGDKSPTKTATIEDTYAIDITVKGKTVTLHFIDTGGQQEFWTIAEQAIAIAHIVVVVCDIKREETLEFAGERISRVRELRPDDVPMLLVCNKIDQVRGKEEKKKALNMAQRKNIEIWYTSAKENLGIVQLQIRLVELVPHIQTKRQCCNLV